MISIDNFGNLRDLLQQCGEYVTLVRGASMSPMLVNRRDAVLLRPVTGELKPYDVVVYPAADHYVCHRILEVHDDVFIIRGDNCRYKEFVPKEAVFGVVAGFWRSGRYIPVSNPLYRLYARIWVAVNPLLWVKGRVVCILSAIKRKIFRG